MNEVLVLDIFKQGLYVVLITSAPMLLGALLVGFIIALFQATTQIQEPTLAFVPKIIAVFALIIVFGSWIMSTLIEFTENVFDYVDIFIR